MFLNGKTAVIYGGGGSIGGAVAKAMAAEGARTVRVGRTAAPEIDVLDALDEEAVDRHAQALGGIDIFVNALGFDHVQGVALADLSLKDFAHPVVQLTRAHFITAKMAARYGRKDGVVICFSTPGARMAGIGFLGNAVGGAAVEALSRTLAAELAPQGIRTVCIRPHAIADIRGSAVFERNAASTGQTVERMLAGLAETLPLKRLPTLEEVGNTAAFVASPYAAAMTGTVINMSAGAIVD